MDENGKLERQFWGTTPKQEGLPGLLEQRAARPRSGGTGEGTARSVWLGGPIGVLLAAALAALIALLGRRRTRTRRRPRDPDEWLPPS